MKIVVGNEALWEVLLQGDNPLQGGDGTSAWRHPASHRTVMDYCPITAHALYSVFCSLLNI